METPSDGIAFNYKPTAREMREGRALIGAALKPGKQSRDKAPRQFGRGLSGWLMWVAAAILLIFYLKQSGPPAHRQFVPDDDVAPEPMLLTLSRIALISGIVCVVLSVVLLRYLVQRQQARWHGQLQMSITPEGLVERRPGMTITHLWDSFRAMEEGKRVVILRTNLQYGIIIPKRLLGDDAQRARAIELLRGYTVKSAIPFTGAFPVIQR